MKKAGTITITGAQLIFKNFQGKKSQYNPEGKRNFGVLLDPEIADKLFEEGWPVKTLKPREDDPEQYEQPWMSVKVAFENFPPIVTLINSRGKKLLDEETVEQLDWSLIKYCDLVIRPYHYGPTKDRPEGGISPYLKAIYVTIEEDELAEKYAHIPDIIDDEL